ncbi:MAG: preprotein translocase subunit SecE [Spirochaetes bacterium]|nr:preprotein translocase subunit SecE [Spirochaetota bacterium]
MRDLVNKMLEFFRESKEELRKVTWPDRDEVTNFTLVVLVAVLIMSLFLWLVDAGIMEIIKIVM